MSRVTLSTVIALLSVGVVSACSGFRPHVRSTSSRGDGLFEPRRPGDVAGGGDIGGRTPPGGAPDAGQAAGGVRLVCRKAFRPSGWIAVAYVSAAAGECPTLARSDSGATAAMLTYYADRPRDSVLDVCADEPAPRGWVIDDTVADASGSCPGVERNGSSTYRIRRVR